MCACVCDFARERVCICVYLRACVCETMCVCAFDLRVCIRLCQRDFVCNEDKT